MLPVASVIVDFDGTACAHDVAVDLLERFGDPGWLEFDAASERGEIEARIAIATEAAMLRAPLEELTAFVVGHCALDPSFPPFARWLREVDVALTIASDGFGFYIPPLLEAAGLRDVRIVTNTWRPEDAARISFDSGHPECVGCGTCKMNAVLEAREHGRVAFVGDGTSDRFASLYADVVFAKNALVGIARSDGVPFVPWTSFEGVRAYLESGATLPGPVEPERCPGWTTA